MNRHLNHAILCVFLLFMLLAGAAGCDSGTGEALPGVPTMVLPADGATDQANALELRWHPAAGALTYHVQVARDAAFANNNADEQGLIDASFDVMGLQLGVPYYWHVRAENEAGVSDWSATWTFTPTAEAVVPAAPGLKTPHNNAQALPTSVIFEWTASAGARSYHIQISQEPSFLRKDVDIENVLRTSKPISKLVNGYTYFWRVRAHNPAGFSTWSDAWIFVIETG